jgi:hypothetical protein
MTETAYGEHGYAHEATSGRCRICGFSEDDGRGEHIALEKLPAGTELRPTGRKQPLPWGGEGYAVMGYFPEPGTTSVGMKLVGYVSKAEEGRGKPWLVYDMQGYLVVSRAPIQNDSRDSALWLAEQAEWPVR